MDVNTPLWTSLLVAIHDDIRIPSITQAQFGQMWFNFLNLIAI